MNWSGLVFVIVGLAAVVASNFLIRHRAEYYEFMAGQQEQIFGSKGRRLSAGGSSNIFLAVGIVGVLIGAAAAVLGLLTLVGALQPPN
ncbi:MAG: hypothetical protein JWP85_1615 [Rhodoglobus sp.]|nr:hypothetical protein [Rhodoglobus sp.]